MKIEFSIGSGLETMDCHTFRVNGDFVEFFENYKLDSVKAVLFRPQFVRVIGKTECKHEYSMVGDFGFCNICGSLVTI